MELWYGSIIVIQEFIIKDSMTTVSVVGDFQWAKSL